MNVLKMIPVVGKIIDRGLDIIDDMVPDKDLAAKLKAAIREKTLDYAHAEGMELIKAQMAVIVAEIKSGSWIATNWRPVTMLAFVTIIVNNYILYPYLALFWSQAPVLEIPPDMWALLKIGLGGYVVGRSVEKTVAVVKK